LFNILGGNMKQKRFWNLLFVAVLALALFLSAGLVIAAGAGEGARGGAVGDATPPQADPVDLTEGFDDITTLPGSGWFLQNNSSPIGSTGWFQGNSAVFPAHAGAATAYIGANFNNASGAGTVSNWLLTPVLNLNDGDTISFWTRSINSTFPDRLEVRMSTNGASTNVGTLATDVGDFTQVLTTINPSLAVGGYPGVWTEFVLPVDSVPTPTDGRIAFRYFVTNSGPSGANGDYIGIDTFDFTDGTPPAAPDIAISISPPSQNVSTNGIAVFTVTVTNTGDVDLVNVNVSDPLVPDCDNAIGGLVVSATVSYGCEDTAVAGSYTNVVTVTSDIPTDGGGGGPSATDSADVIYTSPTGVSLTGFGEGAMRSTPIWLGLLVLLVAGLGLVLRRKLTA
jgi:hypothetical protein